MKIGHLEINLKNICLDSEESLTLRKLTGNEQISHIDNEKSWRACKELLESDITEWIGKNQVDHPRCKIVRKLLFLMHNWKLDNWRNYLELNFFPEKRIVRLWIIPCDLVHEKMISLFSKKALALEN